MALELHQNLVMRPEQRMILAPRMIQSMEILQMPIMALQEKIQQELQENPVLELKEPSPEDEAPAGETEPAAAADESSDRETEGELIIDEKQDELDFNRLDALSRDWEDHFSEEHRPSRNSRDEEADKKHDAMQNMPSRPQSLHDYLTDQIGFLDVTPDEVRLMRFIISHLDDNGYLVKHQDGVGCQPLPLEEILQGYQHAYDPSCTLPQVEHALRLVQKLDPPGVGARDTKECLLLQLTPETPYRDLVQMLVLHHMEDIAHNRLPVIQKRTGFDIPTIKNAIEVLKHLNPKPGSRFLAESIPYVVPDIIVERKDDGEYDIRLVDDWLPNIYISRRCVEMYKDKRSDPQAKEWLKRKIQAAQWLLDSIEQRRGTLLKVTRAIIQHQKAFLDRGPEHIEPLKMQQIADQVGVHVTTVSRAVDDKWVQTPRGIFPLKRFFGGGTQTATGEEVAWETIKQKLLEIIDKEDKSNPLSDEDLVAKLNEAGYPVARRTVTKYRKILKIPSSRQRKDWTAVSEKEEPAAVATEPAPDEPEETPPEPEATTEPVGEGNGVPTLPTS
jgi:RNA polymerase sigma-54 factor